MLFINFNIVQIVGNLTSSISRWSVISSYVNYFSYYTLWKNYTALNLSYTQNTP